MEFQALTISVSPVGLFLQLLVAAEVSQNDKVVNLNFDKFEDFVYKYIRNCWILMLHW